MAALSTDPTANVAVTGADVEERKERELETLQEWQDVPDRELGVKRFAEEAEQYLRDDIERMQDFVEYR